MTSALAIFFALQMLGWSGYQSPSPMATSFAQPAAALQAIRLMTGPVEALLLLGAAIVAWRYPLTRERHRRIRGLLERRRMREVAARAQDFLITK